MRIISRYRDYYDHVAHYYNGGDPNLLYKRDCGKTQWENETYTVTVPVMVALVWPRVAGDTYYHYSWLVINAKPYLLLKKSTSHREFSFADNNYHILDQQKHSDVYEQVKKYTEQSKEDLTNKLILVSKAINQPVFQIANNVYPQRGKTELQILTRTPNLSTTGIPSIIPPTTMYQDIAHFMANVLRDSPDSKPPVNVSDADLLIAKGFDKRISFRHRKG